MSNAAQALPRKPATQSTQEIELRSEARALSPKPGELIELLQVSHPRLHATHYTLSEGRFLSVHRRRPLRGSSRYWLDLAFLDPTPHLLTIIDRRWLWAAAGLSLATLALVVASALSDIPWHQQAWLPGTVLLLNASLFALVVFFQRSRSLVRFHSRNGDAVFLELANNLPNRNEFRDFLRILIQHIHTARQRDPRKPYRMLGAELVETRRLHEAGAVSRDAYDRARERILRKHRQANIRTGPRRPVAAEPPPEADIIEITLSEGKRPTEVAGVALFGED